MAHELPALPYDYSALEPTIDAQTMKLHHDMHHGAYVKNLNAALEKYPNLQSKSAEDLIRDLNAVPVDIRPAVRNNGGGHVNHSMFWKIMKPKGGGDPRASSPFSATMSGSMPITSNTITAAPNISRPGGTQSTGMKSTSA